MIRRARPSEAPRIRAIVQAAYARYVPRIGRRPAPMDADIAAQIADGHLHVWDAEGAVVGSVCFWLRGDAMHLDALAVAPEASGRGIGKALIAFVEHEAARLQVSRVTLYTNAKMTENLAMYPHLGFREVGRRQEDGFDRVFYEKQVLPAG